MLCHLERDVLLLLLCSLAVSERLMHLVLSCVGSYRVTPDIGSLSLVAADS